ncbi:Uncharacterised protein [Mycobacterium tuberculosis]|nr:Uncharacterised protein [Mycobacterium tuberculosis]
MVLAPMSSVIKGAIQSLSPMVAFLLECVEPLVPLSFSGDFFGREPTVFTVPPAPVLNL